jgi:hypothetical protein
MITSTGLRDLDSVVIPRLEFPFFQNFLSKFPKSGIGVTSVIYKGILGKIPEFFRAAYGRPATLLGHSAYPWALFDLIFSRCNLLIERSTFILWNGKIPRRKRGSLPLKSLNSSPSPSLLLQSSCSSSPLPWIPSMLYPPLPPQGRFHH